MRYFVALVALTLYGLANAQIISIGPFTGAFQEGYETQRRGEFLPSYTVFSGQGTVNQVGSGQGLHITSSWGFFYTVYPHTGSAFMGGAGVNYEYVFNTPAVRFGGYFATNADLADATVTFFDENGNQIGGAFTASAPLGQWAWNGWQTNGPGIKRVRIVANNRFNGFIMNDTMQYDPVPEPATLLAVAAGFAALAARRRK
ncbi:MAG: hypothetical protein C4340_05725 [Armatimonadota bacterium]